MLYFSCMTLVRRFLLTSLVQAHTFIVFPVLILWPNFIIISVRFIAHQGDVLTWAGFG